MQTDEDGIAEFETIVPGWYSGRAPHIHIKVIACGNQSTCASLVVSQHVHRWLRMFITFIHTCTDTVQNVSLVTYMYDVLDIPIMYSIFEHNQ